MNILKHHFRFDSSSATDRFPSSVQYLLLSGIFESDKAGSWSALASKAPFHARANDCCLSSWATGFTALGRSGEKQNLFTAFCGVIIILPKCPDDISLVKKLQFVDQSSIE